MLSQSDNELLTRVGPGTPCGDMMRRYWWPIGLSENIEARSPVPVKLLGEEFILFRDLNGRLGLLDKHCCHRSASLEFGRVEENGLRCCYHGWLYDTEGRCLDQPCEPPDSAYKTRVRQKAYAVREKSGLIFGYIGPDPVPVFPKYDLLVKADCNKIVQGAISIPTGCSAARTCSMRSTSCAFMPASIPNSHSSIPRSSNGATSGTGARCISNTRTAPRTSTITSSRSSTACSSPAPGMSPISSCNGRCRPTTSTASRTRCGRRSWTRGLSPSRPRNSSTATKGEYKRVEDGCFNLWDRDQDDAACDSQGPIANRTREHLGQCDKGVILMRKMVRDAIADVQAGKDPRGVIRDKNHPVVDLWAYKTELGSVAGEIRNPELGEKLQVVAPFDF